MNIRVYRCRTKLYRASFLLFVLTVSLHALAGAGPPLPDPATTPDSEIKATLETLDQARKGELRDLSKAELQRTQGVARISGILFRSIQIPKRSLDPAICAWVLKVGNRSLKSTTPDWELIALSAAQLTSGNTSRRNVNFAREILKKPLPRSALSRVGMAQNVAIQTAIRILVEARSKAAQDVLLKIALAPVRGPNGILPFVSGVDDEKVRIARVRLMLSTILWHAPKDRVLPFIKEVAGHHDPRTELGKEIAGYLDAAKCVAKGIEPYRRLESPPLAPGEPGTDLSSVISETGEVASEADCLQTLQTYCDNIRIDILAVMKDLDNHYASEGKAWAPDRVVGQIRFPKEPDVLQRLVALIHRESAKETVNWKLMALGVKALNFAQQDKRIENTLEPLFRFPLGTEMLGEQIECLSSAISILAQQGTAKSLDVLYRCATFPIARYPDFLPSGAEMELGRHEELCVKIANWAASAVIYNAPQDTILPFFEAIEPLVEDELPFGQPFEAYMRMAKRAAAGEENITNSVPAVETSEHE